MQISSAVLAVSLVLILKKKKIGKVCQLFLVFSPAYVSGLVILLASLRSLLISASTVYNDNYFHIYNT